MLKNESEEFTHAVDSPDHCDQVALDRFADDGGPPEDYWEYVPPVSRSKTCSIDVRKMRVCPSRDEAA